MKVHLQRPPLSVEIAEDQRRPEATQRHSINSIGTTLKKQEVVRLMGLIPTL